MKYFSSLLGHAEGGQCTHRVEPSCGQLERLSQRVRAGEHQGVGERGQEPAKRVGLEALATRARTEQIKLRLLDPILGLTALTLQPVVERLIAAVAVMTRQEIANDEARVDALGTVFEPRHHAPGDVPALGGIGEFADLSLFLSALFIGLFHRAFDQSHLAL